MRFLAERVLDGTKYRRYTGKLMPNSLLQLYLVLAILLVVSVLFSCICADPAPEPSPIFKKLKAFKLGKIVGSKFGGGRRRGGGGRRRMRGGHRHHHQHRGHSGGHKMVCRCGHSGGGYGGGRGGW